MGKKLYVGNLSFDATEDEVRALFSHCGDITSIAIVTDRMTGRSRGFAFVEMAGEDGAQRAISEVTGQLSHGRPLRVSEAVERPRGARSEDPRGGGGGYDRGGGGGGDRGDRGGRRGDRDRTGGGRRDRKDW